MTIHKFNKNKAMRKINSKNNSKTKITTIVISLVVLIGAIIYFSFARFENTTTYSLINGNVHDFNATFSAYLKTLNNDSVTQDDGSGDKNMRFIGPNPNNYILFGCNDEANPTKGTCELWRIIGIFDRYTTYVDDSVKIIKDEPIYLNINEDTTNDWPNTQVKNILNSNTYKYASSSLVETVDWRLGSTPYDDVFQSTVVSHIYDDERETSNIWQGKVGLPYISDFFHSVGPNITRQSCIDDPIMTRTYNVYDTYAWSTSGIGSIGSCTANSWLMLIDSQPDDTLSKYTITKTSDYENEVFMLGIDNIRGATTSRKYSSNGTYQPTVYLKKQVYCKNCNESNVGTIDNPYKVSLKP